MKLITETNKMKRILVILFCSMGLMAPAHNNYMGSIQNDTIDYEQKRMYIEVPIHSILTSGLFSHDEGFMIVYAFLNEEKQICTLTVDYSVMTYNHVLGEDSYDKELWNTFNKNIIGSRCYIKNGRYYRVDRFSDGLEIYYENVPADLVETVDAVMKSVLITQRRKDDQPLNWDKRLKIRLAE